MPPLPTKKSKLHIFNNLLSVVVIALALYIAILPIWPSIAFWWQQRGGVNIPYSGELADSSDGVNKQNQPIPKENRIVVPSLNINEEIKEGPSLSVIDSSGVWRRPNSSASPLSGNMVIAGHRFTYTDPYGAFYHLDKLKNNESFALYWEGKEYIYKVVETKVVSATSTQIEQNTSSDTLTLYTCTPIWSAKDRLVIIAKPIKDYN